MHCARDWIDLIDGNERKPDGCASAALISLPKSIKDIRQEIFSYPLIADYNFNMRIGARACYIRSLTFAYFELPSTSFTLRARSSGANGFWMKSTSSSRTP